MAGLDPALQVSGVLPLRALEAVSSNEPLKQGHMRALEKIGLSLSPAFEEAAEVPGEVEIVAGEEVRKLPRWAQAFQGRRKDSQYFEIVEETICPEFEYGYFLVKDGAQRLIAIQPFFVLDQDLLAGVPERWLRIPRLIRRYWPGFLKLRTLMAGCAAGEGHFDASSDGARSRTGEILNGYLNSHARALGAALVVLKEFPAGYRRYMSGFIRNGFTRIPSMPMTRLDLSNYASMDDYFEKGLKRRKRKDLLKKYRTAAQSGKIEMEEISDISPLIDDIYPLYLQVLARSKLQFEVLTKAYFLSLLRRMPYKVRYFVWRRDGKIIAFALCQIENDTLYGEYLGLDYSIALDIHLYFFVMQDIIAWAIANGFKALVSSSLGYSAKLQMGHVLEPLDLYVRHTSPLINAAMKRLLPLLEPVRSDETLKKFPNYADLWGA